MTANGNRELPGERGNAHAVDETGSSQKITTGHVESGLGETGIDLRIENGLPENESTLAESRSDLKIATARGATVRGRTATERMTVFDALERMTANSKRSESENDGHGHESCPSESELYNPSLLLDLRIGKH